MGRPKKTKTEEQPGLGDCSFCRKPIEGNFAEDLIKAGRWHEECYEKRGQEEPPEPATTPAHTTEKRTDEGGPSGVNILTIAKAYMKRLGKLNNRIADLEDAGWLQEQLAKTKGKRDVEEGMAVAAIKAARAAGFEVTPWDEEREGAELKDMPPPNNWPRGVALDPDEDDDDTDDDLAADTEEERQEQDDVLDQRELNDPPEPVRHEIEGPDFSCSADGWWNREKQVYECEECSATRTVENTTWTPAGPEAGAHTRELVGAGNSKKGGKKR